MNFLFIKGCKLDAISVALFVVPLIVTLSLALIFTLHNEALTADAAFNNEQFIIMQKNCYLKIP